MRTDQELFDVVARHLLRQNERALSRGGHCAYRVVQEDRTLRCAIGCLISDEAYDPRMENTPCTSLAIMAKADISGVQACPGGLAYLLQQLHDHHSAGDWRAKLTALAAVRGLSDLALHEV